MKATGKGKGKGKGNMGRWEEGAGQRTNPYKLNKNSILATVKTTFRFRQRTVAWTVGWTRGWTVGQARDCHGRRQSGKIPKKKNEWKKKIPCLYIELNWNAPAIVCVSLWSSMRPCLCVSDCVSVCVCTYALFLLQLDSFALFAATLKSTSREELTLLEDTLVSVSLCHFTAR